MKDLVLKLEEDRYLSDLEFKKLIECSDKETINFLHYRARNVAQKVYGNKVYIRGLIEFTNYCKNDCFYCGIRKSNSNANRYRLTKDQILECCDTGYQLGFRTFVLQGGEDGFFTDEKLVDIISSIKSKYNDCALTLSIGEKSKESYKSYFDAGADRFLLRHETAEKIHYSKLHPDNLFLENRMNCLYNLKEIGYQVGSGFMVGSPYQTLDSILKDLRFLKELNPQMVGIGPFIPHKDTKFFDKESGSVELTLKLLSIIRLMLPNALIPATTALGTADNNGREKGVLAGANVIMPNLSPMDVRGKYLLYNNKKYTGDEASESVNNLKVSMKKIGYEVVIDRGDYKTV